MLRKIFRQLPRGYLISLKQRKSIVLWNNPYRCRQLIPIVLTGNRPLFFGEQGERPIKIPKSLFYGEQGRKIPPKKSHCSTANRDAKSPKNTQKILKQIASNMVKKHNFGVKQTGSISATSA